VTLLGDACHPMLPFIAQGAAQAIEDGATLTACLSGAGPDVGEALGRYQRLRLPRTARLQALSAANKTRLHPSDGRPPQRARDARAGHRHHRLVGRNRRLDLRARPRGPGPDPLPRPTALRVKSSAVPWRLRAHWGR
jgi:2-polyprenyl-6-methoxyphenol hydroxylase-like FAD-dependent oxidoreductase